MRGFLVDLLFASEKAAQIARLCRKEKDLFKLLIEEKKGKEKNAKFAHDFKTLADVLIQETVRHDLGQKYPTLADNIQGEETCVFTNTLGETIKVGVQKTEIETSNLLHQVLDHDRVAADLLSREVHSTPSDLPDEVKLDLEKVPIEPFNVDNLGIWIDPIDSTNNYIWGNSDVSVVGDLEMTSRGLQVVTVLIGVYDRSTGQPVIGVINQPFAEYNGQKQSWRGQVYWGICHSSNLLVSSSLLTPTKKSIPEEIQDKNQRKIVISFTEEKDLQGVLERKFKLFPAAGAGYKLLCVARGFVDLYVTQKGSTFKWDSCAGHAIIRAVGGNCLDFVRVNESLSQPWQDFEIKYHQPLDKCEGINRWSNCGGVLAFRDQKDLDELLVELKKEQSKSESKM